MNRIRKNKSISFNWTLLVNGEVQNLEDRINLEISKPDKTTEELTSFVVQENVVSFYYRPELVGQYILSVILDKDTNSQSILDTQAFYSVDRTWNESKEESSNLDVETLELDGNIDNTNTGAADLSNYYTKSQVNSLLNNYLETEEDPVFKTSPAYSITTENIVNWDNKSNFSGSYNDLSDKPKIPEAYNDTEIKNRLNSLEEIDHSKFLTSHQSLTEYLKKTEASNTYQPKGEYLTKHQSLEDYAKKDEIPTTLFDLNNNDGHGNNYYIDKTTLDDELKGYSKVVSVVNAALNSENTYTIYPNIYYKFYTADYLNITLNPNCEHGFSIGLHLDEFIFEFVPRDNSFTLSIEGDVKFQNVVSFQANHKYIVSIVDGLAVIGDWNYE